MEPQGSLHEQWQKQPYSKDMLCLLAFILESQNSASELKDEDIEPITPRVVGRRNRTYPKHFTSLKNSAKGMKPFLVADIETITLNSIKINHLVI